MKSAKIYNKNSVVVCSRMLFNDFREKKNLQMVTKPSDTNVHSTLVIYSFCNSLHLLKLVDIVQPSIDVMKHGKKDRLKVF